MALGNTEKSFNNFALSIPHSVGMLRHSLIRLSIASLAVALSFGNVCTFGNALALESGIVDFSRDVAPILEARCASCHQGDKAKGGFVVGDRDAVLGFIELGDSASSSLWTDYLTAKPVAEDPKSLVMPPSGPLPSRELAILKLWIDEGAAWPDGYQLANVKVATTPIEETGATKSEGFLTRAFGAIGYFHPAVIHFPIALLIFGGAAAGLSFFTGSRAQAIAFYCLLWGSIATVVSAIMGWSFAIEKGFPSWDIIPDVEALADTQLLFRHRWMGVTVALLSVIILAISIVSRKFPNHSIRHVWRIGMLVLAILVSITGHQGGELVYGDILAKAVTRLVGK
jgi:uncharacterized membrane protein